MLAIFGTSCASNAGNAESLGSDSVVISVAAPVAAESTTTVASSVGLNAVPLASFPEPGDGEVFDEYIADRVQTFRGVVRAAAGKPTLTPEIDFPEIAEYAVDPLLASTNEYIAAFAQDGTALQEPAESAVGRSVDERTRVSRALEGPDEMVVTVFECSIEDVDVVDVESGEIKISEVLTRLAVITMQRFEDGWKAVDAVVTQTLEGVDGCFLAGEAEYPY